MFMKSPDYILFNIILYNNVQTKVEEKEEAKQTV